MTLRRDQARIDEDEILKVINDFLGPMLPSVNIEDVEGGGVFMSSAYFFGYDNHPRMKFIGLTPSCANMIKFLFIAR